MSITSQHYRSNKARVECGAALVLRDQAQEVFMIRRTGAHGEGTWSFPGGWVWPGEEPARAACREAWEEVGVNVLEEHVEFLGYTSDTHPPEADGAPRVYGITLWFQTTQWTGTPRNTNPDRITETGWFDPDDMPTPLFVSVLNGRQKELV